MWKSTFVLGLGMAALVGAAWLVTSLIPLPTAKAQSGTTEELTFLGKTRVVGTSEYLHHYRSNNGTNCFVVVVERGVKTAQHLSCVRN